MIFNGIVTITTVDSAVSTITANRIVAIAAVDCYVATPVVNGIATRAAVDCNFFSPIVDRIVAAVRKYLDARTGVLNGVIGIIADYKGVALVIVVIFINVYSLLAADDIRTGKLSSTLQSDFFVVGRENYYIVAALSRSVTYCARKGKRGICAETLNQIVAVANIVFEQDIFTI